MADETLVYKARFDASGIEQGNAAATRAFEQLDKTAAKTFSSMEKNSQKATRPGGDEIGRRMERDLAKYEAAKNKTVKIDDDVYEQQARLQAKREDEYQAALHQANLAEANLVANGWEKKLTLQRVMMEKELSEYAGNLEAQEQITRKHTAIMQAIQMQRSQSTDRPERVILQRLGTVTSAANRAQGVLFGVSPLLGNLGGGLAQTAAGLMGVSTSLDAVAVSGAAALLPLGIVVGTLAAVGVAVGLFVKNRKELQELRDNPNWLGNPEDVTKLTGALDKYRAAQAAFAEEREKQAKFGRGNVPKNFAGLGEDVQKAEEEIRKLTGYKGQDFQGFIDGFGGMQKAVESFALVTQARLMSARSELAHSQIDGLQDGVNKALKMEDQRYKDSQDAERRYLAEVLLDTKKSEKDKQDAVKQSAATMDTLTQTHEQNQANIRKEYRDKDSKELKEKIDRDYAAMRDRSQKNLQEEQRSMEEQGRWLTEAQTRQHDEAVRLIYSKANTETETLLTQQRLERDALDTRIASYQFLEDETIKAASIQIAEQEKVAQSARHVAERQKAIGDLNRSLAASYVSLGSQIANTFDIGPMKEFFGWLERIRTMVQTIQSIQAATSALSMLGGGGAGVSLLGLLGFANGGDTPVGQPYIVGERGPEIRMDKSPGHIFSNEDSKRMMGGAAYNMNVSVNVGAGADTSGVKRAVTSAVLEAAQQIESLRNQRHYNDGTLA